MSTFLKCKIKAAEPYKRRAVCAIAFTGALHYYYNVDTEETRTDVPSKM